MFLILYMVYLKVIKKLNKRLKAYIKTCKSPITNFIVEKGGGLTVL